jgi:hypothetical protein
MDLASTRTHREGKIGMGDRESGSWREQLGSKAGSRSDREVGEGASERKERRDGRTEGQTDRRTDGGRGGTEGEREGDSLQDDVVVESEFKALEHAFNSGQTTVNTQRSISHTMTNR